MRTCWSLGIAAALVQGSYSAADPQSFEMLDIPRRAIGTDVHNKTVNMPMGGIGTWLYNDSTAETAVVAALMFGARLIDTANIYENQVGVAQAILKANVPRDELFISTKVPGGLDADATMSAHERNLQQLGVETVDLLLAHFPCAMTDPPSNCSKASRQTTWKALEALYKAGKARAIGVSHYCQRHLEDILEINMVPIAVNQQEWHVGMGPDPEGIVSFCKKRGISYQSFSPLCGPCGKAAQQELMNGTLTSSIGQAYNVSGAQVALRWLVEHDSPVIPKTSNIAHLHENLNLFGARWGEGLTATQLAQLNAATSPPSAEPVSDDCKLGSEMSVIV